MTVRFSDAWQLHGLQALVLENARLRVTVLPELGGKIWSIVAKAHDREMLWHHPRMPPRRAHYGATYDNWFCGGWDEVFPNDFPIEIDGESYPDHGEVWSLPARWQVGDSSDEAVSVSLEHAGIALPTCFRKVLTLRRDEPVLRLAYEIANDGPAPLDVHWKTHPALPVTPGARLHLAIRRVIDDRDFGETFAERDFVWPIAPRADGRTLDLRSLPDPDSGTSQFYYGVGLEAGYAAISYPGEGVGFGLAFDPILLNSVWIFGSYGGWRGLNTVILEPCTGYLANLEAAIANRSVLTLAPHSTVETTLTASVLDGEAGITAFAANKGTR
ncbi:MAG: aldose 1-epimerase family protein [Chloroflexota bacterium]|nr:aldose 1-epimerase family protein [Chloroflexota bacterium]